MKTFIHGRKFLPSILLFAITAFTTINLQAQTATITPPDRFLLTGNSITFTATAVSGLGDAAADKQYIWTVTGPGATSPAGPVTNLVTASGNTNTQAFTFTTVGDYTVSVKVTKINGAGAGSAGDNVTVSADVTVVTANSPINCSSRFFVSHGTGGDATDQTTLNNLSFDANTITANDFTTAPTGVGFNAIGISPDDGYLYGVRYVSGGTVSLIKVGAGAGTNVVNKGTITVGNATTNIAADVFAGCFSAAGTYFFIDNNNKFYKLSKEQLNGSRIATAVGTGGSINGSGVNAPPDGSSGKIIDIAISPTTGKMFGVSMGSNSSSNMDYRLYEIDTTTGALTRKGAATSTTGQYAHPSSAYLASLFFIEDGTLYGYRSDGQFLKINTEAPQSSTAAGTGPAYTYADGCSCSFRVGHTLTRSVFCPTNANKTPTFQVKIVVSNSSGAPKSGLTFSLPIGDPAKRFRFTQTAAAIKSALVAKGYANNDVTSTVTLGLAYGATGTNYNTLTVTGFKIPYTTGGANKDSFLLDVQFYTAGGTYTPVPFQSTISGLPVTLGTTDKSGNGVSPQAATIIDFKDCGGITLASKLMSFKGDLVNNVAMLNWETSTEDNVYSYTVERSFNGVDFTDAGAVTARNQPGTYTFNDPFITVPQKVFYRLRIAEVGGYKYSGIVLLGGTALQGTITVGPNPFSSNFQFSVNSAEVAELSYVLSTVDGKQIKKSVQRVTRGSNTFFVNDLETLPTGVYVFTVSTGSEVKTMKLVKK